MHILLTLQFSLQQINYRYFSDDGSLVSLSNTLSEVTLLGVNFMVGFLIRVLLDMLLCIILS